MADRLTGMDVLVRTVRLGGISAAARALHMSPAMATKHLDSLEERLGTKLVHRTTRRVIAMQQGKPILNMAASFQTPEEGLSHQGAMPDVAAPDTLKTESELRLEIADRMPPEHRAWLLRPRPIEIRPVDADTWFKPERREPVQMSWFRICAPVGDDPALHRAILSYASDMALLGTSLLPHGIHWMTHELQSASLDHAVWLHEDFRADDWLLYVTDSPWTGHARGFNRGRIFARDGRLVASTAQEGLMRLRG